jgi:uncharacterized protein (DUF885 family)
VKKTVLYAFLIFLFAQARAGTTTDSSAALLARTTAAYDVWLKQEDLQVRQQYGLPITHLPKVSLEKAQRDSTRAKRLLAELAHIKVSDLTHEQWLNRETLAWNLGNVVEAEKFYWLNSSATAYNSPIATVNDALRAMKFQNPADAERYLDLVAQYTTLVRQIHTKLEGQAARMIVLPRDELTLTIPFWKGLAAKPDESPLGVTPDRLQKLPPEQATQFRARLAANIEKEVNPAITDFANYLEGPYARLAPTTAGISQYPGGRAYYEALVKYHTTLDLPLEKIHQIGLDEVKRISAEMDVVQKSLGFTGTAQQFRESLKKNPRTVARNADETRDRLNAYLRRIEPEMLTYFKRMPKAPYAVKRLQPELEGSQTFGYYQQPTADDPTGYYMFNGSSPQDRSMVGAGDLIYHEILPGHHFQGSLVLEGDLPAFRKQFGSDGYGEGWGEYASEFAGDMGMYRDPYDHYGRLLGEMMMAVRLVVDTGMNNMGWSREKAAQLMRVNTALSDREIFTEILRYSVDIPGQALAYHLGQMEFVRLREKAKRELGSKFDIREFHEAVLGPGSVPLTVLAKHIDWWIAEQKK